LLGLTVTPHSNRVTWENPEAQQARFTTSGDQIGFYVGLLTEWGLGRSK
jgi:hypothetical protein